MKDAIRVGEVSYTRGDVVNFIDLTKGLLKI